MNLYLVTWRAVDGYWSEDGVSLVWATSENEATVLIQGVPGRLDVLGTQLIDLTPPSTARVV
jgi:hypothetical protein